MFPSKATTLVVFLLLLPLWAFGQQKGGRKPVNPTNKKSKVQKPATPERKAAPEELKKLLENVLSQENEQQQKEESSLGYEIDGLLIDETLTKFGHDFYDIFYSGWVPPDKVNNYTIRIKEKPAFGRGFLITVQINDETIIEQNLQPNYNQIEEIANNSVAYATEYLMNYENLKNQIESDDQKGTGIF